MAYSNKTVKPFKGKLIRIKYSDKFKETHDITCEIVASTKYHIMININKSGIEKPIEYKNIISLKTLKDEPKELPTSK